MTPVPFGLSLSKAFARRPFPLMVRLSYHERGDGACRREASWLRSPYEGLRASGSEGYFSGGAQWRRRMIAAGGRAFLRSERDSPPPVILSGHAALSRHGAPSRRNLGRGGAVGQNIRTQYASYSTSAIGLGDSP